MFKYHCTKICQCGDMGFLANNCIHMNKLGIFRIEIEVMDIRVGILILARIGHGTGHDGCGEATVE